MKDNSNNLILANTVILYIRLAIVTVCSLITTRFALQALGVNDYGLFSVLGSIISFVAIINTIMVSTSYRYIAVSLGKGDIQEVGRVFNVCLVLHIFIALATAIIAFPVGEWYIRSFVNYDGPIGNALMVFRISIIGSILSFIAVPYAGLLTAKERFIVFCGVEILGSILKMGAAILILFFFSNKLLFYTVSQGVLTALPTLIYWIYCRNAYPIETKWIFVKDFNLYKEMLVFSGWVGFGAVATVGKAQGAQLLVNAFFTTAANAALGVANTVNHFITLFSSNVTKPIAPQLTKSYAASDYRRCNSLLIMSTKFSFLTMLLVSSPFFSDINWILNIWLGQPPELAAIFVKLLVLDALVCSFNQGISTVIFANGRIQFYQITINTVRLLSIVGAFFVLKSGAPPYSVFYVYILFSFISLIFAQWSLHRVGGFSLKELALKSYVPSILVCILYAPSLLIKASVHPLIHLIIVFAYLCVLVFFVGLHKTERKFIVDSMRSLLTRVHL